MNKEKLIKEIGKMYKLYLEQLEKHGTKEFSSTIYQGYKIKTLYREIMILEFNKIDKSINKKSSAEDIKKVYAKMKKVINICQF